MPDEPVAKCPFDDDKYTKKPIASLVTQGLHLPYWVTSAPVGTPLHSRRHWRSLQRCFSAEELREHKYYNDAWIAVDSRVYDITEHIATHPGWHNAGITTVLSILAHIGSDCSDEFHKLHRSYPIAYKQLKSFYIGDLELCQTPE